MKLNFNNMDGMSFFLKCFFAIKLLSAIIFLFVLIALVFEPKSVGFWFGELYNSIIIHLK